MTRIQAQELCFQRLVTRIMFVCLCPSITMYQSHLFEILDLPLSSFFDIILCIIKDKDFETGQIGMAGYSLHTIAVIKSTSR